MADIGRRPINETAMTAAERQERRRARIKRQALLAGRRGRHALHKSPKSAAADNDLWSTPPCLLGALANTVLPPLGPCLVWEPAAGAGAIVDTLRVAGLEVIASDVESHRRDILELDFRKANPPPSTRGLCISLERFVLRRNAGLS